LSGDALTTTVARKATLATGNFAFNGRGVTAGFGLPLATGAFAYGGHAIAVNFSLPTYVGIYLMAGNNASTRVALHCVGSTGAFALSGHAAAINFSLPATAGNFAFNGHAATCAFVWSFGPNTGLFALAGHNAQPRTNYKLSLVAGFFAFTGISYGSGQAKTLDGDTGSFAFTGSGASPGFGVIGATGHFAWTGVAIAGVSPQFWAPPVNLATHAPALSKPVLALEYPALATPFAFAFTGHAADVARFQRPIDATTGAYAFTGRDADFAFSWHAAGDSGVYGLTLLPSSVSFGICATGAAATFNLASIDAAAVKLFSLPLDIGVLALAGNPIATLAQRFLSLRSASYTLVANGVVVSWRLSLRPTSFALTGDRARPSRGFGLAARRGAIDLVTPDADTLQGLGLDADTGEFDWLLAPPTLNLQWNEGLDPAAFAYSGFAPSLAAGWRASGRTASYVILSYLAQTQRGKAVALTPGAFALAGAVIALRFVWGFGVNPAHFALQTPIARGSAGRQLALAATAFSLGFAVAAIRTLRFAAISTGRFVVSPHAPTYHLAIGCGQGSYALSTPAGGLAYGRRISITPAAFALAGTGALPATARELAAASGALGLIGHTGVGRRIIPPMLLSPGAFTLAAESAATSYGRRLSAQSSAYVMTAKTLQPIVARGLPAPQGVFTISLETIAVGLGVNAPSPSRTSFIGSPATPSVARKLSLETGDFGFNPSRLTPAVQYFEAGDTGRFAEATAAAVAGFSFAAQPATISLNPSPAQVTTHYGLDAASGAFGVIGAGPDYFDKSGETVELTGTDFGAIKIVGGVTPTIILKGEYNIEDETS
jgi:hypothetical protein